MKRHPDLEPPIVSVIIPAYNASTTLRACLDSIRSQSLCEWEAIIVDDGSTDSTSDIVKEIQKQDPRFRLIVQKNMRQGAARNAGIEVARGKYIALLDADDISSPNRLDVQVRFLENNKIVTVLGGARIDIDANTGKETGVFGGAGEHSVLCADIFTKCPFSTSTVMARRGFFDKRRFSTHLLHSEDHDLWLRSYLGKDVNFHNLQIPLVIYRKRRRMSWRHYREISRIYYDALVREGRWPRDGWYAIRPLIAALWFNPFAR